MSGAIVIMRDEEGRLPTSHELRLAGFAVSTAVAVKQKNSEDETRKRETETMPPPALVSG